MLPKTLSLTPSTRGRYGAWLQADHLVSGSAEKTKMGTALFVSAVYGDSQTSLFPFYAKIGFVRQGTFSTRTVDSVSFAFAYGQFNPRLHGIESELSARGFAVPRANAEQLVEVDYGVQAFPWLTVRPNVQYVIEPSGDARNRNAIVLGLNTSVRL